MTIMDDKTKAVAAAADVLSGVGLSAVAATMGTIAMRTAIDNLTRAVCLGALAMSGAMSGRDAQRRAATDGLNDLLDRLDRRKGGAK